MKDEYESWLLQKQAATAPLRSLELRCYTSLMFHLTIFGGSEVRLKDRRNLVITIWGGTDILMPTLAEKIMRLRELKEKYPQQPLSEVVPRRTNVITFQGGTSRKLPTFGREIDEMVQLRDCGLMPEDELLELWQEAAKREDFDVFGTFTMMGGTGEDRPSEDEELQDLLKLVLKGIITAQEYLELKRYIAAEGTALLKTDLQQKLRNCIFPARSSAPLGSVRPLPSNRLLTE